jgi:hypothetical protein
MLPEPSIMPSMPKSSPALAPSSRRRETFSQEDTTTIDDAEGSSNQPREPASVRLHNALTHSRENVGSTDVDLDDLDSAVIQPETELTGRIQELERAFAQIRSSRDRVSAELQRLQSQRKSTDELHETRQKVEMLERTILEQSAQIMVLSSQLEQELSLSRCGKNHQEAYVPATIVHLELRDRSLSGGCSDVVEIFDDLPQRSGTGSHKKWAVQEEDDNRPISVEDVDGEFEYGVYGI